MDEIGRIEPRIGLHDLRVLMVVVEAGSMGKAARLLATSQPAVSRSIGELEHALGVRLLDRSAQGIEPTPYGRAWSTPNEVVRLEVWLCHRGGLQWRRNTSQKRSSRICGRLMF